MDNYDNKGLGFRRYPQKSVRARLQSTSKEALFDLKLNHCKKCMLQPPRFELGSNAWKAFVITTKLRKPMASTLTNGQGFNTIYIAALPPFRNLTTLLKYVSAAVGSNVEDKTRDRKGGSSKLGEMAKHHPDLIMCRKLPGIAIGRLCEKCKQS